MVNKPITPPTLLLAPTTILGCEAHQFDDNEGVHECDSGIHANITDQNFTLTWWKAGYFHYSHSNTLYMAKMFSNILFAEEHKPCLLKKLHSFAV